MNAIRFTVGAIDCDCGACTPHECTPRQSGVYECINSRGRPFEPHDCNGYHCGESWSSPECAECGYGNCAGHGMPGTDVELVRHGDGRWTVRFDGRTLGRRFYSASAAERWARAAA